MFIQSYVIFMSVKYNVYIRISNWKDKHWICWRELIFDIRYIMESIFSLITQEYIMSSTQSCWKEKSQTTKAEWENTKCSITYMNIIKNFYRSGTQCKRSWDSHLYMVYKETKPDERQCPMQIIY